MTNSELYQYMMTTDEKQIWNNLKRKIIDDCKVMLIPYEFYEWIDKKSNAQDLHNHTAGYNKYEGYYYIENGDRGTINLVCHSQNIDDMRWYILEQIAGHIGQILELRYRKEEEKNWRYLREFKNGITICMEKTGWKYNAIHDSRKFWFEYEIQVLSKVFDSDRMKPFIEKRTGLMNRWFNEPHWGFSFDNMSFIEISDSIEHD